jgi:cell division septation protein DedD
MRDVHRMKEKLDLSLDGRQVGGLLVGGIVVLGAVFLLGVVVGKRLATHEQSESAPDILTALDHKAQTTLTFQDELTRNAPAVRREEPRREEPKREAPEPAKVAKSEPPAPAPAPAPTPAPARPPEEPRAARAPAASAEGAWTLQLSASQSKDEADKFAARLRDRGYAPFIAKAEVPGKGTWYRVRMGGFPTKEAAARYLQDFKRETQLSAFVAANQ